MFKCQDCGNTGAFVVDFRETVYGSVVARWDDECESWECDWNTRKDQDGTVEYGEHERECAECGSLNIEEVG